MVGDIIAGVTGLGVISVYGFVIRSLQAKIDKMEAQKLDKTMCEQIHSEMIRDLERGHDRFKEISAKLDSQGDTLSGLGTNVALLTQTVGAIGKTLEKMAANG